MIKVITFIILTVCTTNARVDFYSRVRNFSIELIHFTQIKTNGDVVLAPFGLWTLLSEVAFETEYVTKKQLFRSLITNINDATFSRELRSLTATLKEKSDGVTLVNDNFVLLDTSLKISYDFVTRMRYIGANILRLDFRESTAARLANILTKTNPQAPTIFDDSDFTDSQMIIGNVFLFKGTWSTPFNMSNTYMENAYNHDGKDIGYFGMMSQELKIPQSDIKELEALVSELSIGADGKYCMLIIQPYEGVTINKVYRHLAQVTFKSIFDKLQNDVKEDGLKNVTLKLPKIAIDSLLVLNGPLNDMGIYDAFEPQSANFIKLSSDDLYIDTIVQRTKIFITETGIDAVSTIPSSLKIADKNPTITGRPFIFFVVNKPTMTIVLGGISGRP